MGVAAHDRHSRLSQAELGTDHVHDALTPAAGGVDRDAELVAVPSQRRELQLRQWIRRRVVAGRDVVVHRRERQVGPANRTARQAKPLERLRRGHLVHEVQVDVEQVGHAVGTAHDVALPDPVEERFAHALTLARRRFPPARRLFG